MKFEYQDKIDSYVQGDMTADERSAFEHEVQNNEELREQLDYTRKVKTLITSRQEKMTLLKQWEEEWKMEDEQIAATQYKPTGTEDYRPAPSYHRTYLKKPKRLFYWLSGIAAVLVVGFFIDYTLFMDTSFSGKVGMTECSTDEVVKEEIDTISYQRVDSILKNHQ